MKDRYPSANWHYLDENHLDLIGFVDGLRMVTGRMSMLDSGLFGEASPAVLGALAMQPDASLTRDEVSAMLSQEKDDLIKSNKDLIENTCSIVNQSVALTE